MADDSFVNLDDTDFGQTLKGHQPGDRVFDRFVLEKLIGRGGMGVVWLARDERLGRSVALKFTPDAIRYDDAAVEELKNETRRGLDLSHPYIVKIYDFLLDDRHAAVSMEYVDGPTIGNLRVSQPLKVFEPDTAREWVAQLLEGLAYAHTKVGIVHRDIKPGNLLIHQGKWLKITDFGIAASISEMMQRSTGGQPVGTMAYMSPQQAIGKRPSASDDLYAVGSTLFELFTGKPPYYSGDLARQIRESPVPSIVERRREFGVDAPFPAEWDDAIQACLAKEPEDRPESAEDLGARLGIGAPSVSPPPAQTTRGTGVPDSGDPTRSTPRLTVRGREPPPLPATPGAPSAPAPAPRKSRFRLLWIFLLIFVLLITGGGWAVWHFGSKVWDEVREEILAVETHQEETTDLTPPPVTPPEEPDSDVETPAHDPAPEPTPEPGLTPPDVEEREPAEEKPQTLQAMIDAAAAGETVIVPAGRYEEQIKLKEGVHLQAESPGDVVVATDGRRGSALSIEGVETGSVSGFVFEHSGTVGESNWPVVFVRSSSVEIKASRIARGMSHGLVITGGGRPVLSELAVERNAGHGIVVERGARLELSTLTVRQNGGHGLHILNTGTVAVLSKGQLEKNGLSGVTVDLGARIEISEVASTENGEAGLVLVSAGDTAKVAESSFEKNLIGMVVQNGGRLSADDCVISANEQQGLLLVDPGPETTLQNCRIEKNALDGVAAVGGEGHGFQMQNSTVARNGLNGVYAAGLGLEAHLEGNHAQSNGQAGFHLTDGAVGLVKGNRAHDNSTADLEIAGAGEALVVEGNTLGTD